MRRNQEIGVVKWVKQNVSRGLQWLLSRVQRQNVPQLTTKEIPYEGIPSFGNSKFFLGTKTGLLYFDGRKLWQLFEGRVYGITRYEGRWYTTWNHRITLGNKPLGSMASVLSFRFHDGKISDLRVELAPLDEEVHQIDAWDEHLYITDTANNRVLECKVGQNSLQTINSHYPNGQIRNGRRSPNYSHINSVFQCGDYVYVMYHNLTEKTGKNSQVALLNKEWNVVDVIETSANSAHNVFRHDEEVVFCDSMNGRLMRHDRVLVNVDTYMRGLAASYEFWLLGGSDHAKREERGFTNGSVYQYSPDMNKVVSTMKIPNCGSLYEIRLVNPEDIAMSSTSKYN
jgi:hypothetical protein